jgi:hypothetical protein
VVPTRQGPRSRGTDKARQIVQALMRDAESARLAGGTSFAAIGRALHVGSGQVALIYRGRSPNLSIVRAAQVLEAVGLELSARAFPVGAPVRDAGQLALLARLRQRVHSHLQWREEVPVMELPAAGTVDRRAWDAAIDGPGVCVRVEAETRVGDTQALERRVALKQRDGAADCVVLLLADTRHHRILLEVAGAGLRAAFPMQQRAALAALRDGRSPAGNALILL